MIERILQSLFIQQSIQVIATHWGEKFNISPNIEYILLRFNNNRLINLLWPTVST